MAWPLARIQDELVSGVQAISFPPSLKAHVPGFDPSRLPDFLDRIAKGLAGADSGPIRAGSVLGHDVRLFDKANLSIVVYVHGQTFVMVGGFPGSISDNVVAIATEIIRAQP